MCKKLCTLIFHPVHLLSSRYVAFCLTLATLVGYQILWCGYDELITCFQSKTVESGEAPPKRNAQPPFQFALLADVKFVLWQAAVDTFRRLPLPRIQPVPHSCSSLQCVPLCSTSLSHSSRALSQVDPQGGRFLLRRGPARPSVTE